MYLGLIGNEKELCSFPTKNMLPRYLYQAAFVEPWPSLGHLLREGSGAQLDHSGPAMANYSSNSLNISGWWFGTFFIFPYIIGNNHPN